MARTTDSPEYVQSHKHQAYRSALESAYEDGIVTPKERVTLDALRDEMGIAAADAAAMERAASTTLLSPSV